MNLGNPDLLDGWSSLGRYLGRHPVTVRRWIERQDGFPEPLRLGEHRVAWVRSEVDAWLSSRPRGINHHSTERKARVAAGKARQTTARAS